MEEEKPSAHEDPVESTVDNRNPRPIVLLDRETGINGRDRFRIMCTIGTASNGSLPVYRAAVIHQHYTSYRWKTVQDIFVAVKYVNVDQEPEAFLNLRNEVRKNSPIPDHQNLLGIRQPFFYRGYFCVVHPFMDVGSLRSIMSTKLPGGIPEDFILVVLKEALTGLSVIHGNGLVHGEISADHIFLNGKPEIKLSFSATSYIHRDQQQPSSSSSPAGASICNWAAAPEVYGSDRNGYTPKADVWLVGITALELAGGGLRQIDRKGLEFIVRKIQKKNLEFVVRKMNKRNVVPIKKGGDRHLKTETNLCFATDGRYPVQFKKRLFSSGFEKMVAKCLALDPANRPTADEILRNDVFSEMDKTVFHFYDHLRNA